MMSLVVEFASVTFLPLQGSHPHLWDDMREVQDMGGITWLYETSLDRVRFY